MQQWGRLARGLLLPTLALLLLTACGTDGYPASACSCFKTAPRVRSLGEKVKLWRCVRSRAKADDDTRHTEAQCREFLASPWLKSPPTDEVERRVVVFNHWMPKSDCGRRPTCDRLCDLPFVSENRYCLSAMESPSMQDSGMLEYDPTSMFVATTPTDTLAIRRVLDDVRRIVDQTLGCSYLLDTMFLRFQNS